MSKMIAEQTYQLRLLTVSRLKIQAAVADGIVAHRSILGMCKIYGSITEQIHMEGGLDAYPWTIAPFRD